MLLLVGLGNPGAQYTGTRHNVGFAALDRLADRHQLAPTRRRFGALTARGRLAGIDVFLAKPQTYMNLSGTAVRRIMDYFHLEAADILVFHDDLDVEPGRIKVAARGGAAGHKGVASIASTLGTDEFARIKIGVGRPVGHLPVDGYVLTSIPPEDLPLIDEALHQAVEAAESFVASGISRTQTLFNRRN